MEARAAIRCKHLDSRRPPAAKQRKIGKAGTARSRPGLRASLQRPPGGKDVCDCSAHDLTISYRQVLVNDLVLLPSPKCPSSSTVAHQSRPSIFIPSAPDEPQRPSCGGGCAHGTLGQLKAEVSPAWIPIAPALTQSAVTTADHFFGFPLAKLTSSAWGRRNPFCPHWPRILLK